jgi:anti-sigma B factor antagonist
MLQVNERQDNGVTVLDLEGNIIMGGGSAVLREALRRLIDEGKNKIFLNFAAVKYIDSSGIGELVSGLEAVNRNGGQLRLFNLPEKVTEVMALSSLLSSFEVYATESDARKAPQ